MRRLGLIGGMSWESTAIYYRLLNEGVRQRLGGAHSANLALISVDFAPIAEAQAAGDWAELSRRMVAAVADLERVGVEGIVLCTNTMHRTAPAIERTSGVPLIHIADATARAIAAAGVRRPLLLATRYTMEQDFYLGRLRNAWGIEAVVPESEARQRIHRVIYDELIHGIIDPRSRIALLDEIELCRLQGIDAVIFGCTEIGLLLSPADVVVPAFDSVALHVEAALDYALSADRAPVAELLRPSAVG